MLRWCYTCCRGSVAPVELVGVSAAGGGSTDFLLLWCFNTTGGRQDGRHHRHKGISSSEATSPEMTFLVVERESEVELDKLPRRSVRKFRQEAAGRKVASTTTAP
ncbi:hypothetical protein Hamer_G016414 [Homarus americanus]|uniref:Uncharacterized protein n=1 Tax=Homarus americanus TaxID=6706 RepID=A0A8J5JTV9_HOMAM|nr:hypothetical protein Hamer_G026568 [Homarus americanus]KAG7174516.1 hypothetical protein Hamer_G016414 [Homarus americanus]